MEEIVLSSGIRSSTNPTNPAVVLSQGSIVEVAKEACEASKAFHLCFIHADIGGRNLGAGLESRWTSFLSGHARSVQLAAGAVHCGLAEERR